MRFALLRQLAAGVRMLLVMTVLCGLAYPLVITGFAKVAVNGKANGSLVHVDGEVVGSELIGQEFMSPVYLHSRPSAVEYDASSSGASNRGPTSPELLTSVEERAAAYRSTNGLAADARVPVDAVTASGSGLDPHISVANARLQAPRVARTRGIDVDDVLAVVDEHVEGRPLGTLGEEGVNVLAANIALDELQGT